MGPKKIVRMAESFLRHYPELSSFVLHPSKEGNAIGSGSYGSVQEVTISETVCAAKKIHDFFQDKGQVPPEYIKQVEKAFVRECTLMSTLRHPHIVQFLGVCCLPGSRLPALVMEKLATSLHDILDPEPPAPVKLFIPASLKRSILQDVARGLSFLHGHSTPIIHRDLSARNVLLSEGMVAKIADLGVARLLPSFGMRTSALTKAPGASIYMPPEALEDKPKYDVRIDIFSFGVLAIFTLSQMFPDPLAGSYMDEDGKMVGRTELERRGKYMLEVLKQFREEHPLVQMIHHCLKNREKDRPTIQQVLKWLEVAKSEVDNLEYDVNKLSLIQILYFRNLQIQKQQHEINQQQQQNCIQKKQITEKIQSLEEQVQFLLADQRQKEQENCRLKDQSNVLMRQIQLLEEHIQFMQSVQQHTQQENHLLKEENASKSKEIQLLQEQIHGMQYERENDVKIEQIESLEDQIQCMHTVQQQKEEQIAVQKHEIALLEEKVKFLEGLQQENHTLKKDNAVQKELIESLEDEKIQSMQAAKWQIDQKQCEIDILKEQSTIQNREVELLEEKLRSMRVAQQEIDRKHLDKCSGNTQKVQIDNHLDQKRPSEKPVECETKELKQIQVCLKPSYIARA